MTADIQPYRERHLQVSQRYPDDANPVVTYLSSLKSERSRVTMRHTLRRLMTLRLTCALADLPSQAEFFFAWHALRYQDMAILRALLIDQFKPATVNRHLSALRGVLKECWRHGYIDAETYRRTVDVENVSYEVLPAGRDVPERDLRALLTTCYEDGRLGIRDLAMIAVLATTGMRRAELAALDLADFDHESGCIIIRHGKGSKQRTVYAANKTYDVLCEWLLVRGDADGALFTSFRRGGHPTLERIPTSTIHKILTRRSIRAGIQKITPHDLRRSFVSNMLDRNIDMVMIAKLTGHSDVRLLARYDRRTEARKQQAASALDLPL